ncbi:gallate dioxygenase [Kerstersia gyiorum]|uniref:gallate dioxygenase n=1 Tax=Kerstersia gyiorum TaxID=206506 RepID=UPI0020A10208|nr:gallate dioxygenase [Kerstersia gyiorum]MCP1678368.1 gallate dioxygenase [Kerstersia gyiorum]MCP1825023.1 gallate dioxygenase [Kerstersia gyiorum]MCP1828539.1 gallate dioxygenase [Kerstersia gyiorum]MCW2450403.1 gallate dioxygenase [Kerstersia gyiorum]
MARIIGAIAASHTPTIGFAFDGDKRSDPVWAPIFEGFAPVQAWIGERKPDVLLFIFNDHVTSFFFDHYSAFALGIGESYGVADEGGGALDHGCFSPLSVMCPPQPAWPVPIVPLQVGVLQFPVPTARRCYRLGQALRRAIESYPEDLKVAIVATGGLSHQVHGERAGFNNPAWDEQFMELLEKDPEYLTQLTQAEYAELGGLEGAEVIMWLVMRGALSAGIRKVHQSYYLPSMTGIATAIYENQAVAAPLPATLERHRTRMQAELDGAEKLAGTYPFDLARSVQGYRINHFLHSLTRPEQRRLFLQDQERSFREAGLSAEESTLIRERDWRGLIHYGASFFVLEKLGAVLGVSNLHIYAAMRGETLEQFQKTRNAPGALYSVAGKQASRPDWDQPASGA